MIESERLILRPHGLADFEAIYAMASNAEVMQFISGEPVSREDMWNRLLRYKGHWALFGFGLFAVFEKESGRFVGETGLADFHRGLGEQFDPFPEAAWVMAKEAHGRGYAGEAVAAAHAWFEVNRGSRRTVCIIHADNVRSIRLAEKMDYRAFGQASYKGTSVTMFERLPS